MALTLGKEATFAECLLVYLAKKLTKGPMVLPLPSARSVGTGQRGSLCRVASKTLSKVTGEGAHEVLICRVSVQ
jgi:hypothetical protein